MSACGAHACPSPTPGARRLTRRTLLFRGGGRNRPSFPAAATVFTGQLFLGGGLGVELKYRALEKSTVNVMLERILEPPWGINGGHDGRSNAATLNSVGTERPVTKESNIALASGDTVVFRTAGGGGYGDPSLRDPLAVADDLRQGYITPANALADYGHNEVNP